MKNPGVKWWHWVIASLMVILGLVFFVSGDIKTMVLDREVNLIERRYQKFCCRKRILRRRMTDITNVVSFKKGHEGVNFYTLEYTIRLEFKQNAPLVILKSTSKNKIIQQYMLVRNFIGVETKEEDVKIQDYSTKI